jgi:AcrR family transcriptional regulator
VAAGETGPSIPSRPPGDRRERRREATRRSLMDAARRLFAAQGVERTRINEITEAADVGFGSFYNHFDSKDAIVQAVLAEAVAAQGAELDTLTAELDDPAEVVAVAHRYFVRQARADPDWGWLLVRLEVSHNVMLEALGPFARRDLARGIRTGRFRVADKRTALFAAGGALLAVMRAVLDGQAPKEVERHHAEGVMRLFGLSVEDAAEVAARPMPATRG